MEDTEATREQREKEDDMTQSDRTKNKVSRRGFLHSAAAGGVLAIGVPSAGTTRERNAWSRAEGPPKARTAAELFSCYGGELGGSKPATGSPGALRFDRRLLNSREG